MSENSHDDETSVKRKEQCVGGFSRAMGFYVGGWLEALNEARGVFKGVETRHLAAVRHV